MFDYLWIVVTYLIVATAYSRAFLTAVSPTILTLIRILIRTPAKPNGITLQRTCWQTMPCMLTIDPCAEPGVLGEGDRKFR